MGVALRHRAHMGGSKYEHIWYDSTNVNHIAKASAVTIISTNPLYYGLDAVANLNISFGPKFYQTLPTNGLNIADAGYPDLQIEIDYEILVNNCNLNWFLRSGGNANSGVYSNQVNVSGSASVGLHEIAFTLNWTNPVPGDLDSNTVKLQAVTNPNVIREIKINRLKIWSEL